MSTKKKIIRFIEVAWLRPEPRQELMQPAQSNTYKGHLLIFLDVSRFLAKRCKQGLPLQRKISRARTAASLLLTGWFKPPQGAGTGTGTLDTMR